jgi:hypothetical protein
VRGFHRGGSDESLGVEVQVNETMFRETSQTNGTTASDEVQQQQQQQQQQ